MAGTVPGEFFLPVLPIPYIAPLKGKDNDGQFVGWNPAGTKWSDVGVLVFEQKFALEDAVRSNACWLEASMHVVNEMPLG